MKTYQKGYRAEMELVKLLQSRGWAVIRSPRSGRIGMVPDVIAIRKGRVVSFEVKSRNLGFSLRKDQVDGLKEWRERSGSEVYLAVKIPRRGWVAISLDEIPANLYIGKGIEGRGIEEIIR